MIIKRVKFTLDTGFVGASHEDEDTFEFEDETTEEEMEKVFQEYMVDFVWNSISTNWRVLNED